MRSAIRLMRSAIIKEPSEDQQQYETTITKNINYIENVISIFVEKFSTRSKYRQTKLKLNKITCTSLEKM